MRLLVLFIAFSLKAKIIQTDCMQDVLDHVHEATWVVFDFDNTLVESAIHAGRIEWFHSEVDQLMAKEGLDRETADALLFPVWNGFLEICPIQTLEEMMMDLVKTIQKKCEASLILTARSPRSRILLCAR